MRVLFASIILLVAACGQAISETNQETKITGLPIQAGNTANAPAISTDNLNIPELSSFIKVWNGGELESIRSIYTTDARYFYGSDLDKFSQREEMDPLVSGMEFSQKVKGLSGSTIKILGEPFGIYEKLAAFQYARESSKGIEKGVTLLRFEDGKVLLQVDLPAHDDPGKVASAENLDLQELLRIWNEADRSAAEREYEANAVVLSDEDLMEAPWRDHQVPPTLQTLLYQFKGWNPEVIGEPIRVGDTLLFSWRWFDKDYPVGYGIRAIQAGESGITRDIRMVIRPWETSSTFMVP